MLFISLTTLKFYLQVPTRRTIQSFKVIQNVRNYVLKRILLPVLTTKKPNAIGNLKSLRINLVFMNLTNFRAHLEEITYHFLMTYTYIYNNYYNKILYIDVTTFLNKLNAVLIFLYF